MLVTGARRTLAAAAFPSASMSAPGRCRHCGRRGLDSRENLGHRRQVADIAIDDAEERSNGRLVRYDRIEITHRALLLVSAATPSQ